MKRQAGFSALILLIAVVVIAGVSTAVYYVWKTTQGDTGKTETQRPSDNASDNNESETKAYFMIADKRVRLPLNDELKGLRPGQPGVSPLHAADESIPIMAPELDESWKCEPTKDGNGTIGYISISVQLKRSGPGNPAASKRIGDFTYGYEPANAGCTTSAKYQKLVNAFKERFKLLEAY